MKKCKKAKTNTASSSESILKFDKIEIRRDDFFCGREEIFVKLKKLFEVNQCVCLTGMPGIGKTSCAAEYAYREIEKDFVKNVFWVHSDTRDKISEGVCKYASKIKKGEIMNDEMSSRTLVEYLRQTEKNLIIFDNVDDIEVVKNYFSLERLNAKCIITTRIPRIVNFNMVLVPPFDENAGKKYLKHILPHLVDEDIDKIMKNIAEKNELLPYKISLIAGNLYQNMHWTIQECLQLTKTTSLVESILKSLEKNNKDTIKLLKCVALVDPDDVPWTLLKEVQLEHNAKDALQDIINTNLCKIINQNTDDFGIKMHRLIQSDLLSHLRKSITATMEQESRAILVNIFKAATSNPDERWMIASKFSKHVEKFLENTQQESSDASQLIFNLAQYYYNVQQNFTNASMYHAKALEMRQRLYNGDHPDVAQSLNSMAVSYTRVGDDHKAAEFYLKALEMRQRLYNGDHPDVAESLNSMAVSYTRLGDDHKAAEFYLKALEMRQRLYSGDHPDVAQSLNNMAVS